MGYGMVCVMTWDVGFGMVCIVASLVTLVSMVPLLWKKHYVVVSCYLIGSYDSDWACGCLIKKKILSFVQKKKKITGHELKCFTLKIYYCGEYFEPPLN